ncbi:MAG: type I-E CRISPR-associated protein Cas6/Cse3/CasE [Faecalibacterium sp.]
MYLTKIQPNMRHPGVRHCMTNCHDMHRTLMSGFSDVPTQSARADIGLLYRIIPGTPTTIWLSSKVTPDPQNLENKGFIVLGTRCFSPLEQAFFAGQTLRFELLAVPSKKTPTTGKNSRRSYLKTQEERTQWLIRKGEQNGFKLLHLAERQEEKIVGSRKNAPLIFTATAWEGVLEVTDEAAFWHGLCNGIGAERAYGAGMLMVRGV